MRAQTKFKSCRQIAAIQTVILTENQNSELSEGSGEDAAQGVTMIAKRDFEHTSQAKKERYEVCRKEGSKMTASLSEDSHQFFKEKNLCTSELCKVTLARIRAHRRFSQKNEKRFASLLYQTGFSVHENSIQSGELVAGGVGTSKRLKRSVLLTRLAIGSDPSNPKYKPKLHLQNQDYRLFVIDLEAAQNSLEFNQTANGSVVCFDSSVRVPHKDHQPQRRTRKVRERRISRRRIVSYGKESTRQRSAEGNLMA